MTKVIHQVLHGYENGHKQLASSTNLTSNDKELIDRISDLSGLLSSPSAFQPYLTGYPLPSSKYYALAKTWLDNKAPRAGCVFTHTLLIPLDDFKHYSQIERLFILFKEPENRDKLEYYHKELDFPSIAHQQREFIKELSIDRLEFVSKYFGKGIRPIVWIDNPEPGVVVSAILNSIWPNLRKAFAFCTLSLNLRELDNRPFDILFAPLKARHNHRRLDEKHFIQAVSSTINTNNEPWQEELAQAIFLQRDTLTTQLTNLDDMLQSLGPKPTDISLLYRIQQLWKRADTSASAAMGIMDLLDSLEPAPQASLHLKEHVTSLAFNSVTSNNEIREVLRNLMLISDRLEQPGFSKVKERFSDMLINETSKYTMQEPVATLELTHLKTNNMHKLIPNTFDLGVIKGFVKLADSNPNHLPDIDHFPNEISKMISVEPDIAVGYYQVHHKLKSSKKPAYDITKIINSLESPALVKFRKKLIPITIQYDDIKILKILLKDVQSKEVDDILNLINKASSGFTSKDIQLIIQQTISCEYPSEVRSWANNIPEWSWEIASVVASTFPNKKKGFTELLSYSKSDKQRALLIAAYIKINSIDPFPNWARENIASEPNILLTLLDEVEHYIEVSDIIKLILINCKEISLANEVTLTKEIDNYRPFPFWEHLINTVYYDVTKSYIKGDIDDSVFKKWMATKASIDWIESISGRDIAALLDNSLNKSSTNYRRTWKWITKSKDILITNNERIIYDSIGFLLEHDGDYWSKTISKQWSEIITTSAEFGKTKAYSKLCTQALEFAFKHTDLPLEEVVIITFPVKYKIEEKDASQRSKMGFPFKYLDPNYWIGPPSYKDQRYELRKKILNAFLNSNWRPENLALSMPDKDVFHLILNMLSNTDGGEEYIKRMKKGLAKCKNSKAIEMYKVLQEMDVRS